MMEISWEKQGLIFDPRDRFDWMVAYSQVPTILEKDEVYRVFFTTRPAPDANGYFVSHISYIDVDKTNPSNVLYVKEKPILDLGSMGTFDEFGIHPTSVNRVNGKVYLYYTGWARGASVPYETWIGLAISEDDGNTFKKISEGPIIGKQVNAPFLANGAYVFEHGDSWAMIYASAKRWIIENNKPEPVYTLNVAFSDDGIDWKEAKAGILPAILENECISRPSVLFHGGLYHMWYGYRSIVDFRGGDLSYRIGYAYSDNLKDWTRCDEKSGIELSESGWDSEMMSYPQVIKNNNNLTMFYNGNFFGKNGFGYATHKIK